ncbi:MAG: ABC transporter permease [Pseudomonadales bacterium]|nr:ABC transporter permease [Pseudomonadales bacterium]
MPVLLNLIKKEFVLLSRDLHGLLLLFVMPALFILIMTFTLQNQYADVNEIDINYFLINKDNGKHSANIAHFLHGMGNFKQLPGEADANQLMKDVRKDKAKFLVVIDAGFERALRQNSTTLQLYFAPSTTPAMAYLIESQIKQQLVRLYFELDFDEFSEYRESSEDINSNQLIATHSLYPGGIKPTSVQQNVPGWLLFAMFFIAIPLSTTMINDRQQGISSRLKSIGVPSSLILAGKLLPYLSINLLQVVLMLLIGVHLIPALGGEKLHLGSSPAGLALVSVCASLASVSYSLLIAQWASTVEQATIFPGVCNIIMAAIGGVMVPQYIMPPAMQSLSNFSPMAWGLNGFFEVLLRGGNVKDVLIESGALFMFASAALILTAVSARRQ